MVGYFAYSGEAVGPAEYLARDGGFSGMSGTRRQSGRVSGAWHRDSCPRKMSGCSSSSGAELMYGARVAVPTACFARVGSASDQAEVSTRGNDPLVKWSVQRVVMSMSGQWCVLLDKAGWWLRLNSCVTAVCWVSGACVSLTKSCILIECVL